MCVLRVRVSGVRGERGEVRGGEGQGKAGQGGKVMVGRAGGLADCLSRPRVPGSLGVTVRRACSGGGLRWPAASWY
ncbi:hypothetical protein E2C01_067235 [Portunus trituberculatus]|uniref:Uncharacterized protein n=1 Tax=Portunus trituberculatus TaxID=210409 RepID=A0A5B7HJ93_PORTR|nr:hypothetical protein [Portunus trituberculatus]